MSPAVLTSDPVPDQTCDVSNESWSSQGVDGGNLVGYSRSTAKLPLSCSVVGSWLDSPSCIFLSVSEENQCLSL